MGSELEADRVDKGVSPGKWVGSRRKKDATFFAGGLSVLRTFRSSLRVVLIDEQPKLIVRSHSLHELFAILLFSLPSIFLWHKQSRPGLLGAGQMSWKIN